MRKTISIILCIMLLMLSTTALAANESDNDFPLTKGDSGTLVIEVQRRLKELGYISFRATGVYGDMTQEGVRMFQERNGLSADGMCGRNTYDLLFSRGVKRNKANADVPRIFGPLKNALIDTGVLADWHDTVDALFAVGDTATVTDFNTGKTFVVRRTGGRNHANVETVSAEAYYTYKVIFGGGGTWERRAVLVEIDGVQYAASMSGMPTGTSVLSTMSGTVDLYFWGSTADFAALKDVEHSSACRTANGTS